MVWIEVVFTLLFYVDSEHIHPWCQWEAEGEKGEKSFHLISWPSAFSLMNLSLEPLSVSLFSFWSFLIFLITHTDKHTGSSLYSLEIMSWSTRKVNKRQKNGHPTTGVSHFYSSMSLCVCGHDRCYLQFRFSNFHFHFHFRSLSLDFCHLKTETHTHTLFPFMVNG